MKDNIDKQIIEKIYNYCIDASDLVEEAGSYEVYESQKRYGYSIPFTLQQIGELVKYLSDGLIQSSNHIIPWKLVRDMRHMCAHKYDDMDPRKIWDSATDGIPILKNFCKTYLAEQNNSPTNNKE
ncbi:MAG: DUF86 domain-containing protein [Ruminococcus sp.]|jgi:uncharacterized protein with HEPN domain|nr:DUF86 domain-containing protein [Ruminococcus sp.]